MKPEEKIYEVDNPCWLSDTFIFYKRHYEDVFLIGDCDLILYIKINRSGKIEEIGNNFAERFHFDRYEEVLKRSDVKEACDSHKELFALIGDEYWLRGAWKLFEIEKEIEL